MIQRVSDQSYVQEVNAGVQQSAHRTQLRPHVAETYSDTPYPLHYFAGKAPELAAAPSEWEVEDGGVLGHRVGPTGELEFLVRWKDWDATDTWWQPWSNFFSGLNEEIVKYCQRKKIPLDLAKLWDRQHSPR